MSVRLKLALTIFATGLVTALLVIATVVYAFQRFERETSYRRGSAFLQRVVANYDNLFELYERRPDEFQGWLRNMVLFETDTQIYLLDTRGRVLAGSGKPVPPGFKVSLAPVLQAAGLREAAYVMGDDPERMDADAVVAVQPVRRAVIRNVDPVVGYLYLVLHNSQLPEGRWEALRSSLARPALGLIIAIVAFTTLAAVLVTVSVTRPLRRLSAAVAQVTQRGLDAGLPQALEIAGPPPAAAPAPRDEFGQLMRAFEMMLATLRRQWAELRRLDHFRREGVSNLSHDLRSPLTATVACLETLEARWAGAQGGPPDDPVRPPTNPPTPASAPEPAASGSARESAPESAPVSPPEAAHEFAHQPARRRTTRRGAGPSDDRAIDRVADRRLIEVALRNTRNAARLVQSLGELAQLDEPEFTLHAEAVDVTELLDDIVLRFAERAAQQGVALGTGLRGAAPAPAFAALDIELFERAVANLVDNALKACAAGARITLDAGVRDGRVRVRVADTGAGIAAADLPHLFDRFYQSRRNVAPATGEGGRGLGLAIVKRIAELHGGSVAVESRLGAGTSVVLSLPAAAP